MTDDLGWDLQPGDAHYRAFVGPPQDYDLVAAMTFGLLTCLGLRQHHKLLDVGCGSLRIGRLLIPYLNIGQYVGIEPYKWLVDDGIAKEVGQDQINIKQPRFYIAEGARGLPESPFDFVLAQSIFSHTGPDLLEVWLGDLAPLIKPTGALVATFLIADDDPRQTGWVYPDCVRYKVETMAGFARKHGYTLRLLDWRHPRQRWALFARPEFSTSWLEGRSLTWNTWLDNGPK